MSLEQVVSAFGLSTRAPTQQALAIAAIQTVRVKRQRIRGGDESRYLLRGFDGEFDQLPTHPPPSLRGGHRARRGGKQASRPSPSETTASWLDAARLVSLELRLASRGVRAIVQAARTSCCVCRKRFCRGRGMCASTSSSKAPRAKQQAAVREAAPTRDAGAASQDVEATPQLGVALALHVAPHGVVAVTLRVGGKSGLSTSIVAEGMGKEAESAIARLLAHKHACQLTWVALQGILQVARNRIRNFCQQTWSEQGYTPSYATQLNGEITQRVESYLAWVAHHCPSRLELARFADTLSTSEKLERNRTEPCGSQTERKLPSSRVGDPCRTRGPPPPLPLPGFGDVYRVEALLAVRHKGQQRGQRGREFLVRWQGYGAESDSWEPDSSILDRALIRAFERTKVQPRPSRLLKTSSALANGEFITGDDMDAVVESSEKAETTRLEQLAEQHTGQSTPAAERVSQRTSGKRPVEVLSVAGSTSFQSSESYTTNSMLASSSLADTGVRRYLVHPSQQACKPRVGSEYQATHIPPLHATPAMLQRTFGSADLREQPPYCRCGRQAVLRYDRWWCASRNPEGGAALRGQLGTSGWCYFELELPPSTPPLCDCMVPSAWARSAFLCERGRCGFMRRLDLEAATPTYVPHRTLAAEATDGVAALLTATAYGPMNPWSFVSPSDCGLGLFARTALEPDQPICEYTGPRLPARLQTVGRYVMLIPGATVVIDGASENSPFACPRAPAIYANHSSQPNARLETWPAPRRGSMELRQHVMVVASEAISAGAEIRIQYELGEADGYWMGAPPPETAWRRLRVPPPPPTIEEPVVGRLADLQTAAASGQAAPPACFRHLCEVSMDGGDGAATLPWDGPEGGDARLHVLVPMLATNVHAHGGSLSRVSVPWAMVATHLPGRSGRGCRDRWLELTRKTWADAQQCHSDGDDDGVRRERCVILGCKRQLLRCHGVREVGSAIGCAEESHVICVPCLERWFEARNELRAERSLGALVRRSCPVCQAELRAVRGDSAFHFGLQKLPWSWGSEA